MEILNLHLANFRNFTSKRIIFDKNLAVIIGPNGSGKSNILEAILLLSGVRPVRVEKDVDLVKFGKNETKIEGKIKSEEDLEKVLTINFLLEDENLIRKSFLVDSLRKRFADFAPYLSIVIFHPQDLELVTGSPSVRRHHLDVWLSSIDQKYHRAVSTYGKLIVRRNKILMRIAERKARPQELDFWDERLVSYSKFIDQKREEFFEFLNLLGVRPLFSKAGSFGRDFAWDFKQSLLTSEKLLANRQRDIEAGMTLSGPHRDDFRFLFKSRDLEFFGSRGEQRMAVLVLKLAELEYYQLKRQSRPILALDDIFSELDWEHREAVLSVVGKQQTIITAAEGDSVPKQIFKKAKIVELT